MSESGTINDELLCRGQVERIGGEAIITVQSRAGFRQKLTAPIRDVSAALDYVLRWLASDRSGIDEIRSLGDIHAAGHRVVHGGEFFKESVIINDEVLKGIEDCIDLAPLHNPNNSDAEFGLCGRSSARRRRRSQYSIPLFTRRFPSTLTSTRCPTISTAVTASGAMAFTERHTATWRFVTGPCTGSHANKRISSHSTWATAARPRLFVEATPVDTSMGMTPLEGLVMGTRSGDLDPAIVNLIATKEGLSTHEVESLLNTQSGLLGISGLTNDMKVLEQELREHDDRRVRLAIEVFCYRARKYIGAFLASMGGADAVVFTGGIGEHSPEIRGRICAGLEWAGLTVDAAQNQQIVGREGRISTDGSRLHAWVIPTNEELLIARDTVRCVLGEPHPS